MDCDVRSSASSIAPPTHRLIEPYDTATTSSMCRCVLLYVSKCVKSTYVRVYVGFGCTYVCTQQTNYVIQWVPWTASRVRNMKVDLPENHSANVPLYSMHQRLWRRTCHDMSRWSCMYTLRNGSSKWGFGHRLRTEKGVWVHMVMAKRNKNT